VEDVAVLWREGRSAEEGEKGRREKRTCLVNEELGEVPRNALAEKTLSARLEELEDLVRVAAVHVALLRKREGDAVVSLAHGAGLLVVLRVLRAELVARETNDDETLVLVLLVELLKSVELRGEAALGGRVEDEEDLALEVLRGGKEAVRSSGVVERGGKSEKEVDEEGQDG
jgi:hypothetical protein